MGGHRTCAIGDVHGRSDLLGRLLSVVKQMADADGVEPKVLFLGDIVDRGPDSRGALDLVLDTLARWPASRLLLGNHDRWFRDALRSDDGVADLWLTQGGYETLWSYSPRPMRALDTIEEIRRLHGPHLAALDTASILVTEGRFAFVHAGVDPARPIGAQSERDCLWIRHPFLDHVGALSHLVVHGHTPMEPPRPHVTENRISIDTGAWFSDVLTALVIEPDGETIRFLATAPGGTVQTIRPRLLDRGRGTALDSLRLEV